MHPLNERRSWIFFTDFKRFRSFLFVQISCSNEISCGFIGLQRLIHVVNREILYGFENFFRVSIFFLNRTFWTPTDLRWFGLVDVLEYERGKFQCSPVFYLEIRARTFRILRIWFCFVDFGLKSGNKPVILLLLLLRRFKTFEFLSLFFSIPLFCDRIGFVASSDEFNAWIAEKKAQWWRFNLESLRAAMNSMNLAWI